MEYDIRSETQRVAHCARMKITAWAAAAVALAAGVIPGMQPASLGAQASTPVVPPGARVVTLTEAVQLARKNAPQTVQARGAERTSRAAVRSAYGAFVPNITASVGSVRSFTGTGTTTRVGQNGERLTILGDTWTFSNALGFSAELFNPNRFSNLRAAKADVTTALESQEVQNYAVALNVEQQFFAVLAARESEDAARVQLAQAEQQLAASRRKVVAGTVTASDSLRSATAVATARLALITAQTQQRDANATLTRLTGSPTPVVAASNDPAIAALDTVRLDSAAIVARALQGPDVSQARAALAAAGARRSSARAAYLPNITASYSRGGSGLDSRFGFGNQPFPYSGQLRLALNYPIFNQFTREQQVAQATVIETNAAATLRDIRLAAQQLAVQYLDALQLGQQQIAVQTAAITAAQEDLRVQQQRYELGLSTIVDVLTAQAALNQARVSLIAGRNTVRLAAARIEALVGAPLGTVAAPGGER